MGSHWALAASLALAIIGGSAGDVLAQSATEWDQKAEPLEGRLGEYRTTTTDNWIRLSPYMGWLFWSGGTRLDDGPQAGLSVEFEPGDTLIASIEFGSNFASQPDGGAERRFRPEDGTAGHIKLEGHEIHTAIYVHVKNPELKAGIFEPAFGLGLGLFYFRDYDDSLPLGAGGDADVSFDNGWVAHATISLKLDFNISEGFKLGFNLKNHILFYASEQFESTSGLNFLGNMETETTALDNLYYAFEPSFYISIAF